MVVAKFFVLLSTIIVQYCCESFHLASISTKNWTPKAELFFYHVPKSAKVDYSQEVPATYGLFGVINSYFGIRPQGSLWTGLTNKDIFKLIKNFYVVYTSDTLINGRVNSHFVLADTLFLGDLSYSIHFHGDLSIEKENKTSNVEVNFYCVDGIDLEDLNKKLQATYQDDYFLLVVQFEKAQITDDLKMEVTKFFKERAAVCFPLIFSTHSKDGGVDAITFAKKCEELRKELKHKHNEQIVCDRTAVGNLMELASTKSTIITGSKRANNLNTYKGYNDKYSATFLIQYGTVILLIFAVVLSFSLLFSIDPSGDITLYKPVITERPKLE